MNSLIQLRLDLQSTGCSRVANRVADRLEGSKWLAAPVLRDLAEKTMLNLVSLTRTRREMADAGAQVGLVGELLQFVLPGPRPITITTARIDGV